MNTKTIKQYLLYVPTDKDVPLSQGNWNIEYYDLWDDIQGRAMALEMNKTDFKIIIEFEDGTKKNIDNF